MACAVDALSIVVAITRARTNGAISTNPSRRTQTLAIEATSTKGAIVGTELAHGHDRAVLPRMSGEAIARTVAARSLGVTVVGALPGWRLAIGTRESIFARTHTSNTHTMVRAHVRTDTLVMIDAAVSS